VSSDRITNADTAAEPNDVSITSTTFVQKASVNTLDVTKLRIKRKVEKRRNK
jgi:hypothetical protein